MSYFHSLATVLLAVLLTSPAVQAQDKVQTQTPAPAATESAAAPRRTLLKVGTGFTRGFELGGAAGLSVPLALGAEYRLAPNWTAYGNVFTGLGVLNSFDGPLSRGPERPFVRSLGFDAGVRHYYHQAKRQAEGRAAGPFVGNYLALHVPTTSMLLYRPSADAFRLSYDYTAIMGVWGLQRRLGRHGLIDAFVGAGLSNPRFSQYNPQTNTSQPRRQPGIATELGIRLSLVR